MHIEAKEKRVILLCIIKEVRNISTGFIRGKYFSLKRYKVFHLKKKGKNMGRRKNY